MLSCNSQPLHSPPAENILSENALSATQKEIFETFRTEYTAQNAPEIDYLIDIPIKTIDFNMEDTASLSEDILKKLKEGEFGLAIGLLRYAIFSLQTYSWDQIYLYCAAILSKNHKIPDMRDLIPLFSNLLDLKFDGKTQFYEFYLTIHVLRTLYPGDPDLKISLIDGLCINSAKEVLDIQKKYETFLNLSPNFVEALLFTLLQDQTNPGVVQNVRIGFLLIQHLKENDSVRPSLYVYSILFNFKVDHAIPVSGAYQFLQDRFPEDQSVALIDACKSNHKLLALLLEGYCLIQMPVIPVTELCKVFNKFYFHSSASTFVKETMLSWANKAIIQNDSVELVFHRGRLKEMLGYEGYEEDFLKCKMLVSKFPILALFFSSHYLNSDRILSLEYLRIIDRKINQKNIELTDNQTTILAKLYFKHDMVSKAKELNDQILSRLESTLADPACITGKDLSQKSLRLSKLVQCRILIQKGGILASRASIILEEARELVVAEEEETTFLQEYHEIRAEIFLMEENFAEAFESIEKIDNEILKNQLLLKYYRLTKNFQSHLALAISTNNIFEELQSCIKLDQIELFVAVFFKKKNYASDVLNLACEAACTKKISLLREFILTLANTHIKKLEKNPYYYCLLAEQYQERSRFDLALVEINRSLELDPYNIFIQTQFKEIEKALTIPKDYVEKSRSPLELAREAKLQDEMKAREKADEREKSRLKAEVARKNKEEKERQRQAELAKFQSQKNVHASTAAAATKKSRSDPKNFSAAASTSSVNGHTKTTLAAAATKVKGKQILLARSTAADIKPVIRTGEMGAPQKLSTTYASHVYITEEEMGYLSSANKFIDCLEVYSSANLLPFRKLNQMYFAAFKVCLLLENIEPLYDHFEKWRVFFRHNQAHITVTDLQNFLNELKRKNLKSILETLLKGLLVPFSLIEPPSFEEPSPSVLISCIQNELTQIRRWQKELPAKLFKEIYLDPANISISHAWQGSYLKVGSWFRDLSTKHKINFSDNFVRVMIQNSNRLAHVTGEGVVLKVAEQEVLLSSQGIAYYFNCPKLKTLLTEKSATILSK